MLAADQDLGLSEQDAEWLIGDLLNGYIIGIFCYGLYAMIFAATMTHLATRGEWIVPRVMLAIVVFVIWVLATACVGMSWSGFYSNFVPHGQSQDSILGYFLRPEAQLVLLTIQRSFIALNGMIAELVNIWRCWVLYNRNWVVVVLPLLGVVCGLISHAFRTVALFSPDSATSTVLNTVNWLTVYCSVTASTNILTTSLILYRILSVNGLKGARTYRGIIAIIVESALLYSVTYVIYLALCIHDYYVPYWSFASWYAEACLNAVTAAAPTLIIGRAMAGRTRLNDSWLQPDATVPRSTGEICFTSSCTTQNLWAPAHDSEHKGEDFVQPDETVLVIGRISDVDVEEGSGNDLD